MTMPWIDPLRSLFSLWWQPQCPLCQRSSPVLLCSSCQTQFFDCALPQEQQFDRTQPQVLAWGRYGDGLKRLLALLKYERQGAIAEVFGQTLAEAWLAHHLPRLPVVPIPLHPHKQQQRGYNQAEWIARSFCRYTGSPLLAQGLLRQRDTLPMFGLAPGERRTNLQEAFALNPRMQSRRPRAPILLIDDIYTTGTTIQAASQTLRQAGWRVWGAAVVARARDR
jgi:ComF family protein